MKASPSSATRQIAHWRHFFRSRDAALARAQAGRRPRRPLPLAADSGDSFAPTEWADTEWPDTCTDPEIS